MSPEDAKGNYNFTNTAREDQSMKFSGRPDAFRVWIKSNTKYNFNISVLLHKQGYYQDPYVNQNGIVALVAHAKATPKSNNSVWTKYEIPVEYDDNTEGRQVVRFASLLRSCSFCYKFCSGTGCCQRLAVDRRCRVCLLLRARNRQVQRRCGYLHQWCCYC